MMTALSFLLGVVPLLAASGAGAASQRAIGVAVFSGMLAATLIGVILIPVLYVVMQILRERVKGQFKGSDTPLEIVSETIPPEKAANAAE